MAKIPFDYEEITVGATAVGLTAAKFEQVADYGPAALVHVSGAAICYRLDGGTPTAATANYLEDGDALWLEGYDALKNFKAIARDSFTALLGVTYYR